MIGRSTCAVTRSDLMRVSHSWTPQLNILEILKHFWPASEPCRQANVKGYGLYILCACLPSFIYPPCKYEGMGMHSWSIVVCQRWGQFRLNLVLYGSKLSYSEGGSIKRPDLQTAYRYRAKPFRVDSNMIGPFTWSSYKVWPYAGQSQLDATIEYSWNFITFWPAS